MRATSSYHSIQALGHSTVHAGDRIMNVNIVVQPATPPSLALRSTVSFPAADSFVKREDELTMLKAQLRGPLQCNRSALCGLGGVGKSRIAIEFARYFQCVFPSSWAFWADAGTPATFSRSFEQIAEKAQLQQRAGPRANITQIVCDWLAELQDPWLLILDGVDDDNLLTQPSPDRSPLSDLYDDPEISPTTYIPIRGNGLILITSRNLALAQSLGCEAAHVIEVKPMSKDAAMALLSSRCNFVAGHEKDAEMLVSLLDGIPLAVTQAAAYLHNKAGAVTIREYVSYIQDETSQLSILQETFADLVRQKAPNNSILHTWRITFDHIRAEDLHAGNLLSILGFFDDSTISEVLLIPSDDVAFVFRTKHIPTLLRFSLIEVVQSDEGSPKQYRMHSLVQLAIRAWLGHIDEHDRWKDQVIYRLNAAFPYGEDRWCDWRICANLFPHVRKALSYNFSSANVAVRADLLCKAAWYHRQRGNYHHAAQYCQESLQIRRAVFGTLSPVTLQTGKELAHIYRDLEKWSDAETELRWVVDGCAELEVPNHGERLDSQSLVGELRVLQGDAINGQQILETVLEEQRSRLGPMNQYTLLTIRKLGLAFFRQGKLDAAEKYLKHAWDHQKTHPNIGIQHLNTIRTGILLAELYCARGSSYAQVVDVLTQVFDACRSLLGSQHHETLDVKSRLAKALEDLTRYRRHTV